MKWRGRGRGWREIRNIEGRRRKRDLRRGAWLGGAGLIAVLLIGYFFTGDVSPPPPEAGDGLFPQVEMTAADEAVAQFITKTLAETGTVWEEIFQREMKRAYSPAGLVLFKGAVTSPCGGALGASGVFYCSSDRKAYFDTGFFGAMEAQLGAKGKIAAAYIVAHEVSHHVQDEIGILPRADEIRVDLSQAKSDMVSVQIELQADCFSGVWARRAQFDRIEPGDIEQAMRAADERNAGKHPNPHSFANGTAEQRRRWFMTGYNAENLGACDTFSVNSL